MRTTTDSGWRTPELDQLAEDFELLGDWDSRYQYVIELGNDRLPALRQSERTDAHFVRGCTSTVYVAGDRDEAGLMRYRGECNTDIMRGVLAILCMGLGGKRAEFCAEFDPDPVFEQLGLFEHLSPTRHVGTYAIADHMSRLARAALDHTG